jgi:multidrug transporter EmrE-like cation transporter
MLAVWPLGFALLLSLFDVVVMSTLKYIHMGTLPLNVWTMAFPVLLYGATPLIFLYALRFEGLAIMNVMWDVVSSILVTALGIYFFKEEVSERKKIGIFVSILAIFLLSED